MKRNKENLYSWVFHFNPYTGLWNACKREHYADLFSNAKSKHILRSRDVLTLQELIEKTDGKVEKINILVG